MMSPSCRFCQAGTIRSEVATWYPTVASLDRLRRQYPLLQVWYCRVTGGYPAGLDERARLRFSRISIARCADLVRCSASA